MEFDVVIMSLYGRFHWLAQECTKLGLKVCVVDATEAMGPYAPEDWEGPFGVFKSEKLTTSQFYRLSEDDDLMPIDEGFVVWRKSGVLELQGALSAHQYRESGLSQEVHSYIGLFESTHMNDAIKEEKQNVKKQPFQRAWLAHLGHSFSSTAYVDYPQSLERGDSLPLFSKYFVHKTTRRGLIKSRRLCEDVGVTVFCLKKLLKSTVENKFLRKLTFEDVEGKTVTIEGRGFAWLLSKVESAFLNSETSSQVFKPQFPQPQWCWQRFRFQFQPCSLLKESPKAFVMIESLESPWTHENFVVMQETTREYHYDLWVRMADHRRFDKKHIEDLKARLDSVLKSRIPALVIESVEMPQSYHYSENELGPAPFVLFDETSLLSSPCENVWLGGSDTLTHQDWAGVFDKHYELYKKLETRFKSPEVTT